VAQTLQEFYEEIKDCERCALSKSRTKLVFGSGSSDADIIFIGEAPGYYEDKQGIPFVGAAGKLLDELLEGVGLKRSQVYIANVLKCRPPNNRDPLADEIETCKPYLLKQIEIIKPKIICPLGNFATRLILEKNVGISKVHGQKFQVKDSVVFPIFHPAAALHQPAIRKPLEEDFVKLKKLLDEGVEITPYTEQMGLF